jgi:hypothetical protein
MFEKLSSGRVNLRQSGKIAGFSQRFACPQSRHMLTSEAMVALTEGWGLL